MKPPWTRSNREEVIALLWLVLYYVSEGKAAEVTRYLFIFMAVISFLASIYYSSKDNK